MTSVADIAAAQLLQMIKGYWVSQIVGTLAQLEIADHLAHCPLNCEVLAGGIGCNPDATFRLLRAAADVGLVAVLPDTVLLITATAVPTLSYRRVVTAPPDAYPATLVATELPLSVLAVIESFCV